jgi:demethylsterigmatocystin 6-O-methyltransferase
LQTLPENHCYFNRFMQAQHQGMRQWPDVFPLEEKNRGLQPTQAVSIDVGGVIGHQSNALRQRLSSKVTNPIIVQDLDLILPMLF